MTFYEILLLILLYIFFIPFHSKIGKNDLTGEEKFSQAFYHLVHHIHFTLLYKQLTFPAFILFNIYTKKPCMHT